MSTQLTPYPVGRENWDCVDEVSPDDTDYVKSSTVAEKKDLYSTPSPNIPAGSHIVSVTVYWRARYVYDTAYGRPRIRALGQSVTEGTAQTLTSAWVNRNQTWTTNPQTGNPWTVNEVNDLDIGVGLLVSLGEGETAECSQLYAEISYNWFGNQNIEASDRGALSTEHTACRFTAAGDGTVQIDKLYAHVKSNSGTINVEVAVYDNDAVNQKPNNRKGAVSNPVSVDTNYAWREFSWTTKPQIPLGADYWLAFRCQSGMMFIKIGTGSANQDRQASGASLPDPWGTAGTGNAFKESIYVEYSPVGASFKEVADSFSFSDGILCNKTLALSDTVGLADLPLKDWAPTIADLISVSEIVEVIAGAIIKYVTDAIGLTEQIKINRAFIVSDTMNVLDQVFRHKPSVTVTEALALAEMIVAVKTIAVMDQIALSDMVLILKQLRVIDAVDLMDVVSTPTRVLHVLESVGLSEDACVGKILVVSDQMALVETVEKVVAGGVKTRIFLVLGDFAVQLTG